MFCALFHYRYLIEMANRTPKISGAGLGNLIEETPACTPVPQASSTVAHWNYDRYFVCVCVCDVYDTS
jgi:hypothetical protein